MGYSINFYLDNAVSDKSIKEHSSNIDSKREIQKRISQKPLQIFVYLRYSGKTIKVYTERKCTQKQWDPEKQRVDARYYKAGSIQLNKYLGNIDEEIGKKYETNNNQGAATTSDHIKDIIDTLNNRDASRTGEMTFEKAFKEFIEVKKQKHSNNTIKKYNTTLKHLTDFSSKKKIKLHFDNINLQFENKFRDYLSNIEMPSKKADKISKNNLHTATAKPQGVKPIIPNIGMANNSIAKYIKVLKTFMNFCTEDRNYNPKLNTHYKKFDSKELASDIYALSITELMKLNKYKFDTEAYSQVRDVFCFLAFTGLRFSDAENLKREDIKNNCIHIRIKKTKDPRIISLNQFAKKILDKYKDEPKPLPIISNANTNEHLHKIGKLLEFNELVKKTVFKGPKVIETYVPKYEILTTHLGRKSFITNSLILGMPERNVKEESGHKNESNFRRYVAFADTYKQKVMNDTWSEKSIKKAQK